jgi:hypothetical protein
MLCSAAVAAAQDRPIVGAIRWDAWAGGPVTKQVERTLGPAKYHDRLPWFAEVVGENEVRILGGRQPVMDREIEFAANAGLDYWAFLVYPQQNTMSVPLALYLKSPARKRIAFCLILHNTLKSPDALWPKERDRAVGLLRQPGYQTVLDGRPLVYAFVGREFPFGRFAEFRAAAKEAGLNPYCVFMGWNPQDDYLRVSEKGFDAVSAYAMGSDQSRFANLAATVERRYWQAAARAKVPCIPLVTTGWDKRPRQDHPVSWEKGHSYHTQKVFPSKATPAEIAAHLRRALAFVKAHPKVCPASAIIVYAWNEHDEGGWLCPTRRKNGQPDTSRLKALGEVLKNSGSADRRPSAK